MRKLIIIALAVVAPFVGAASAAADPIDPSPSHPQRTWTPRPEQVWPDEPIRQTPVAPTPVAPTPIESRTSRTWNGGTAWVYVVVSGDTLWGIASRYCQSGGLGWKTIYSYNGLTSTTIYPGDALRIPKC